jgi:NADH-quinone oxidoreductase subunit H
MSIGVYGIMIGGWASNNKFSLIGAVRASQMVYEVAMGFHCALLMMGNFSLRRNLTTTWNELECFLPTISFLIFLICVLSETNRTPFDLAEM